MRFGFTVDICPTDGSLLIDVSPQKITEDQANAFYRYAFVYLSGSNRCREAGYIVENYLRIFNRDEDGYVWDTNHSTWPLSHAYPPTRTTDLHVSIGLEVARTLNNQARVILRSDTDDMRFRYSDSVSAAHNSQEPISNPERTFATLHRRNPDHCHFIVANCT